MDRQVVRRGDKAIQLRTEMMSLEEADLKNNLERLKVESLLVLEKTAKRSGIDWV